VSRKRRGRKPDQTGRSKGKSQFLQLFYAMARHPAWHSLSGPAVKLWIELRMSFNGRNNGQVFLSYEDAACRLHLSKSTVKRAYAELEKKGFLRLRAKGDWYGRRAHEWILTDLPYRDQPATRDWENWRAQSKVEKQNAVPRRRRYRKNSAARVPTNGSGLRLGTNHEDDDDREGAA
jgi:DNA-binding transcriptional MocR family regulator